jgi:Terpene synthase family 2, C-terminal metal binding
MKNRRKGVIPDMEEYLKVRRALSGFGMVLDLFELNENMTFPSMDAYLWENLSRLKRLAMDIISCSLVRARNIFPDSNLTIVYNALGRSIIQP